MPSAPSSRPPVLNVSDPRQWKVISAPIRLEIMDSLRRGAPCTIAEIARDLERPATTLYRHVEALERAGFVTRAGFRKNGRHVEGLVDLAADDFRIAFSDGGDESTAVVATGKLFMRAGYATLRDAAAAGGLRLTPDSLNVLVANGLGRLTPGAFAEVRGLLHRMKAILDKGRVEGEGDLYSLTMVLTPVKRGRKRVGRAKPGATGKTKSV